jgi:hypothetical protein
MQFSCFLVSRRRFWQLFFIFLACLISLYSSYGDNIFIVLIAIYCLLIPAVVSVCLDVETTAFLRWLDHWEGKPAGVPKRD